MEDKQSATIHTLHPELSEAYIKAAPDYYNRMIDQLVRMADGFEHPQPLIVICPDDNARAWFQCSQAALDNVEWIVGAMEQAKAELLAPEYIEFTPEESGEKE